MRGGVGTACMLENRGPQNEEGKVKRRPLLLELYINLAVCYKSGKYPQRHVSRAVVHFISTILA